MVGAHPDDIELGASGLAQRLLSRGHDVTFLILTDDDAAAINPRREEAIRAASSIGLSRGRVLFGGFPDGGLRVSAESVGRLRELSDDANIRPNVVVAHSSADSHNDHEAAHSLVRATFRNQVFLYYSIHISAESRFAPRLFIELTRDMLAAKEKALAQHVSQESRINKRDRAEFETTLGTYAALGASEGFEVETQVGAIDVFHELMLLNDSSFHRLWLPRIQDDDVYLFYEAFTGQPTSIEEYSRHHESAGRDRLRESFAQYWIPRSPLHESFSNNPDAETTFARENVVLAGGPVNNPLTRRCLNRFMNVDWVVDYGMPGREPVFVRRKSSGQCHYVRRNRRGSLVADLAVLTIIDNPMAPGKILVSCSGVHGLGTQGLLFFLADPGSNGGLLDLIGDNGNAQFLLDVDVTSLGLSVVDARRFDS